MDKSSSERYTAREGLWAIINAIIRGNNKQIKSLVDKGIIKCVCDFIMEIQDEELLLQTLYSIENIFKCTSISDENISIKKDDERMMMYGCRKCDFDQSLDP